MCPRITTIVQALVIGGLCACSVPLDAACAAGPKPHTALEQIFYDMGVIGYCGLSSEPVSEGFQRQLRALVVKESVDQAQIQDARNRALTMVEWEWDNRGLGGFRGWCRSEGEAAVKRFSE